MSSPEANLAKLGIELPVPAAPVANYLPWRISGSLLVLAGQITFGPDGKIAPKFQGKLGAAISPETGIEAAQLCAINLLAQARSALGTLDRIKSVLHLRGFIAATPDFTALAGVMNGASDLMVNVLGDAGRHARSTIGVAVLPLDSCVEVEAMMEITP